MSCTRPHTDPEYVADGGLPEFLCRECHPEYNATPESNAKFFAELHAKQREESARQAREREIRKMQIDIEGIERSARNEIVSLTEKIEDLNRDPDVKEKVINELQAKLDSLREYHGMIPGSVRETIYTAKLRKLARLEAEAEADAE